tara:strand:- start:3523 stop:3720 length:198 start_codon:yes stop_codon:yes gene_type:complete
MEFVISFIVFLVVVMIMAIGVILGKKRIQGSCGGLASVGIEKSCDCETGCNNEIPRLYAIQEPKS